MRYPYGSLLPVHKLTWLGVMNRRAVPYTGDATAIAPGG